MQELKIPINSEKARKLREDYVYQQSQNLIDLLFNSPEFNNKYNGTQYVIKIQFPSIAAWSLNEIKYQISDAMMKSGWKISKFIISHFEIFLEFYEENKNIKINSIDEHPYR